MICLNLPETLFRVASSLLIDMLFYYHFEIQQVNTQDIRDEFFFVILLKILIGWHRKSHALLDVRVMQQHVFDHTKSTCRRVQHGGFYSIKQKRSVFTFVFH